MSIRHERSEYPPFKLAAMLMMDPKVFPMHFQTALGGNSYPGGPSLVPYRDPKSLQSSTWWTSAPVDDVSKKDWSAKENWNPVTGKPYEMTEDNLPVVSKMTPVKGQGRLWNYGYNRAADALAYIITEGAHKIPVVKVLCVRVGDELAVPGGFIDEEDGQQSLQNFPHLEDFVFAAAREFTEECFTKKTLEENPHIYRCVLESMARNGTILGRNIPMTCDPRTTQNAGVCTSPVAFELPEILMPYISKGGDGEETFETLWVDCVTPYMPGDLAAVVPMRANHNHLLALLTARLDPILKLPFCREVWEYIRGLHHESWMCAEEKSET